MDDWVSSLREQVAAGLMKPRTYNRRIAAISSLYRWASEPTRSAVTGIPRNPMPRRATYVVPKLAKPMSEDDLGMVLATIARAAATSTTARRDFVMVKGSYLLGCRVSELCRLQWKDIEPLDGAGQVTSSARAASPAPSASAPPRWSCSSPLGRGAPEDWLFPSNKRNGPLTRQGVAARMARWGKAADVHLYPHRCRHTHATHAIRRGAWMYFTLSATLGHSSTGTTSHYVLAEPGESSSLRLG